MASIQGVKAAGTIESDAVVKALEKKNFNYVGVCGLLSSSTRSITPLAAVGKKMKLGDGSPSNGRMGKEKFTGQRPIGPKT